MRLFQAPLDTPLDSPFSATLSVHGLRFTVCALPNFCMGSSFEKLSAVAGPSKLYVAPIGAFFCTSVSPINGDQRLLTAIFVFE